MFKFPHNNMITDNFSSRVSQDGTSNGHNASKFDSRHHANRSTLIS